MEEAQNKLAVFQEKEIRRVWYKGEWWFSIVDVIEALTKSPQPSR
jgi:DNA-damage-inducible protein D